MQGVDYRSDTMDQFPFYAPFSTHHNESGWMFMGNQFRGTVNLNSTSFILFCYALYLRDMCG
jgi:hypothetical protein